MSLLEELRNKVIGRDEGPLLRLLSERVKPKTGKGNNRIDWHLERLLASINENPCLNISERTKQLGWFADRMDRARKKLVELGFIEEMEISEGRGRPSKFLLLTEKGKEYLGREMGEKPIPVHGNLRHHCQILKLKREYEKYYTTDMTRKIGEFIPDLWCEGKDKGIVEIIDSNHVRRDLEKIRKLAGRVDWIHLYVMSEQLLNHYKYTFESELSEGILRKIKWMRLD